MNTEFLAARVHAIEHTDEAAAAAGAMLAEALHLRRDLDHADRWRTSWGTKTDAGLARTVLRMLIDGPSEPAPAKPARRESAAEKSKRVRRERGLPPAIVG